MRHRKLCNDLLRLLEDEFPLCFGHSHEHLRNQDRNHIDVVMLIKWA